MVENLSRRLKSLLDFFSVGLCHLRGVPGARRTFNLAMSFAIQLVMTTSRTVPRAMSPPNHGLQDAWVGQFSNHWT
eukprot:2104791-Amphidinium_carterae.1